MYRFGAFYGDACRTMTLSSYSKHRQIIDATGPDRKPVTSEVAGSSLMLFFNHLQVSVVERRAVGGQSVGVPPESPKAPFAIGLR